MVVNKASYLLAAKPTLATDLEGLALLPQASWHQPLVTHWDISEQGAHTRWQAFVSTGIRHYQEGRNMPAQPYTSMLSAYLHFGQVSPNQLWYACRSQPEDEHTDTFCSELGWREFSYHLLYHYPDLPTHNLQTKFDHFAWGDDPQLLKAWQQGQTGIPLIDAGMRQLWQTGYMHNRVRMLVGSFLVKNLRLHWHHGERWFWDNLGRCRSG